MCNRYTLDELLEIFNKLATNIVAFTGHSERPVLDSSFGGELSIGAHDRFIFDELKRLEKAFNRQWLDHDCPPIASCNMTSQRRVHRIERNVMRRVEKDGALEATVLETHGLRSSDGEFGVGDSFMRRGTRVFGEVDTCDMRAAGGESLR
jgi:hypothetical protein